MAEGVARMPGPENAVARLLREGYCTKCVKRRLQLEGTSAEEVDIIARRTALEGVCVGCAADRARQAP